MGSPFRELTAEQVAEISKRNKASRTHRLDAVDMRAAKQVPDAPVAHPDAKSGHSKGRMSTAKRDLGLTEHQEQAKLIDWWDKIAALQYRIDARYLFAIPNSSKLSDYGRIWKWAEGLRAGVPDLMLAWPSKGAHGLFIELKRAKGSSTSDDQKAYINALQSAGYRAEVCKGYEAARKVIEEYLS